MLKILRSYLLLMKLFSNNKDKTFYIKTHPECLEEIIKFSSSQEGITKVSLLLYVNTKRMVNAAALNDQAQ